MSNLKAVARILSGSLSGYGIAFGLTILMTRLYSPGQFGAYTTFSGVVAIASVVVTGCIELSIMSATSPMSGLRHTVAAVVIATVLVLVGAIAGVSLLVPLQIGIADYLLCVIATLAAAYANTAIIYSIFRGREKTAGLLYMANTAGRAVCQCAMAPVFPAGNLGLLAGDALSRVAQIAIYPVALRIVSFSIRNMRGTLRMLAREMAVIGRHFLYVMPATLLDTAGVWLLPIGFTWIYGAAEGGLFSFVHRISFMVSTLVNNSVANVLHRQIRFDNSDVGHARLARLMLQILGGMALLCALTSVALREAGGPLIVLVFGKAWEPMLNYALFWQVPFYANLLSLIANRIALVLQLNVGRIIFSLTNIVLLAASMYAAANAGLLPMQGFKLISLAASLAPLTWYSVILLRVMFRLKDGAGERKHPHDE